MKATDNFVQFESKMALAARSVKQEAEDFHAKVAIEFLVRLIELSPVKTGHFKNNWRVGIGAPVLTELSGEDKSGNATQRRGMAKIEQARGGQDIWINNNVNYALYLEFGTEFMEPRRILGRVIDLMDQGYGPQSTYRANWPKIDWSN